MTQINPKSTFRAALVRPVLVLAETLGSCGAVYAGAEGHHAGDLTCVSRITLAVLTSA